MAHTKVVGTCVYCGASEYIPGSGEALHEEHVLPFGLGGDVVLKEASCGSCEKITGRIESIVLNNHLSGPRQVLGLRGRTPLKKAPKSFPIFAENGTGFQKKMIPASDHPSVLFLPDFSFPPAMLAWAGVRPPYEPLRGFFYYWLRYKPEILENKYGVIGWNPVDLDLLVFVRMIAKIAHCWAVHELGLYGFNPLLQDILREPNRNSRAILPYVGCLPVQPLDSSAHTASCGEATIGGLKFVLVTVRLFGSFGAPTYCVVVGTQIGHSPPPLPNNPGGVDILYDAYRISVPVQSGPSRSSSPTYVRVPPSNRGPRRDGR
jgi:hypothetical protein